MIHSLPETFWVIPLVIILHYLVPLILLQIDETLSPRNCCLRRPTEFDWIHHVPPPPPLLVVVVWSEREMFKSNETNIKIGFLRRDTWHYILLCYNKIALNRIDLSLIKNSLPTRLLLNNDVKIGNTYVIITAGRKKIIIFTSLIYIKHIYMHILW